MIIAKATANDKKQAIKIAKELNKWFTKEGRMHMKTDFNINHVIVAKDNKKIVGFLCYSTYCGRMELIWLGVKREFQREGIGKMLLNWLENKARKLKLRTIELETLPEEDSYKPFRRTRAFYYKNGFRRTHYKKATIKGWDNVMIMEKVIN